MLSKYCFNIPNEYGIKIGGVNKLVPSLSNKSKYVVFVITEMQIIYMVGK